MRKQMSLGTVFTVVAAAVATIPAVMLPSFDDIFWQIAEGREVLSGHIPTTVTTAIHAGTWIDHEWLFEAFAAFTYDHHAYPLLVAVCALLGALIPVVIFASVRETDQHDLGAGLAALCSSLIMFKYDAIRPLQFGVAACALLFLFLRRRKLHPLPYFLLAIVWANFHASVVLGPVICIFFALGAWHERDLSRVHAYGIAACAMAAGSICTPSSIALYSYAIAHLGGSGSSTQYIKEWDPFSFPYDLRLDQCRPGFRSRGSWLGAQECAACRTYRSSDFRAVRIAPAAATRISIYRMRRAFCSSMYVVATGSDSALIL